MSKYYTDMRYACDQENERDMQIGRSEGPRARRLLLTLFDLPLLRRCRAPPESNFLGLTMPIEPDLCPALFDPADSAVVQKKV